MIDWRNFASQNPYALGQSNYVLNQLLGRLRVGAPSYNQAEVANLPQSIQTLYSPANFPSAAPIGSAGVGGGLTAGSVAPPTPYASTPLASPGPAAIGPTGTLAGTTAPNVVGPSHPTTAATAGGVPVSSVGRGGAGIPHPGQSQPISSLFTNSGYSQEAENAPYANLLQILANQGGGMAGGGTPPQPGANIEVAHRPFSLSQLYAAGPAFFDLLSQMAGGGNAGPGGYTEPEAYQTKDTGNIDTGGDTGYEVLR